jgi:magnesium transporter
MLLHCVAYQDGKKLGDISIEQIAEYLSKPRCLVWVALTDPSAAELATLRPIFDLHPLAVEDTLAVTQRPKIEEYGDSLFAVLHIIEPSDGDYKVGELAIFAGPHYVVSARSRAKQDFTEVRARCEREPELLRQGAGYIFYALTDAVVDRYFPILDSLEDELETIEQQIFAPAGVPRDNIEALYALKHRLMTMKHAVAPLLEGISNLSGARVPVLCAKITEYFRDIYDHLQRLNQTADSIRETITTVISVNLSMVTLQENETMKRLAAYAALLAVPTMIAGIYGMNFEHMPELKWRYGYEISLIVMAGIDAYLYFRLKRAKWL